MFPSGPRPSTTGGAYYRATFIGYGLQRFVIGPTAHGEDRNYLLVTLGLAVIIENLLLYVFRADTRTINLPYAFNVIEIGSTFSQCHASPFSAVMVVAFALWDSCNGLILAKPSVRLLKKNSAPSSPALT